MSAPILRNVIAEAMDAAYVHSAKGADAQDILTALREAVTIGTREQLDALPQNAAVLVGERSILQRGPYGWYCPGWETSQDVDGLIEGGAQVVLVWHPDWSKR